MLQERFYKVHGNIGLRVPFVVKFSDAGPCARRHRDSPVAALSFKVAVMSPRRFARSRTVGAHFGLTPRRHQSNVDRL